MSAFGASDVIRKTISVRCDLNTAFRIWTEQIDSWWPKSHSRSGSPSSAVVLECRLGGRIYERTPEGAEYPWGAITIWEPPGHFAYHWYLGSGVDRPTRVDVHFSAEGNDHTRVDILHQGPELIGDIWPRNSAIYDAAWERVLPAFIALSEEEHGE